MLSRISDTSIKTFEALGVIPEEASVYVSMVENGYETALTLSRELAIPRTRVYRILDNLIKKGLVYTALGERGTLYKALSPKDLNLLLLNKENELEQLAQQLPRLQDELNVMSSEEKHGHRINYYHGLDGLRQVTYNSLKAKGELLTYEMGDLSSFLSEAESEKYRQKFVENRIYIRTLTNMTKMDEWTEVTEMVSKYWQVRHIEPINNKPFQFEILIYNNIYTMYRYTGNEIFCIEIENQQLADMQRQIFDSLWNHARMFRILNDNGAIALE